MKTSIVVALALAFAGCGDSLPKSLATPASISVVGTPRSDVVVAHSAGEVRGALSGAADDRLAAFLAGTDFGTSDVALVRAGGDRQRLAGTKISGARVTVHYVGSCSPCGGGNPGSYYQARDADDQARAERTDLVRVPKGASVEVRVHDPDCRPCPTDVP